MAKTVSEFRTAPGVATISDADMWETDPGTGYNRVMVPIRINGFAGANGKRFHVDIVRYGEALRGTTVNRRQRLRRELTDWDREGCSSSVRSAIPSSRATKPSSSS
jgi:hypothetical protein